jgi:uncharacterized protein (TIGR02271 family)
MMNLFGLGKDDENKDRDNIKDTEEEGTLQLREEQLDVNKNRVQAGEVTLVKDVVEEQKSMDVPVTHEEVVIERRSLDNRNSDSPITSGENIRIPVSEEHVDVDKHTVLTGEISAHKHDVEETRHIEETVRKEEAHVDSTGDTKVITR